MLNVLLTNDDGIEAEGLQAMRRALNGLDGLRLAVIAPDGTARRWPGRSRRADPVVAEVPFSDGTVGYATDGTPVDCVRLASLGLVEDFEADLVVSGINHGANLGDDITYSGTVAAALEGVVLGLPAIAVSQQSGARALDYRFDGGFGFEIAAAFVARWVQRIEEVPLPARTLINVNVPAGEPSGVEVTSLGKRIYRDELKLEQEEEHRRRYWIYGSDPDFTTSPAPIWRRSRPDESRSHRFTSTSPTGRASICCGASTWTSCSCRWPPTPRERRAEAVFAGTEIGRAGGQNQDGDPAAARRPPREAVARAKELREALEHHAHRYYVLDDPEIGDDAYDALLDELRGLEAGHPSS